MKKAILVTLIFLGIFFLPKNVYASTTITVCNSGCDYNSFAEVESAYKEGTLTDKNLVVELKEGTHVYHRLSHNYINSLTINGVSKDNVILDLSDGNSFNLQELILKNISIKNDNASNFGEQLSGTKIVLDNVVISVYNYTNDSVLGLELFSNNINIKDVVLNNNLNSINGNHALYISGSNSVNIDGLTVNTINGKTSYGLTLDNIGNASLNNLKINNSFIGLYVHRLIKYNVNSSVIVNNSDLSNTTCSCFNVLDNNKLIVAPISFINNKNYQVVFKDNNKLNCAVASGYDTNTHISSNNIFSSNFYNYTGEEIDYDNLTGTIQNINKGSVDVISKYKGVITIEQGSSSLLKAAFDDNTPLSSKITWSSEDGAIATIEDDKILGIKEGKTTITGISDDLLSEYEIDVTVIRNPVTSSAIYITLGICLILILGSITYIVYTKRFSD